MAKLASQNIPVYQKADSTSSVVTNTGEIEELITVLRTEGLNGQGHYWEVVNFEKGKFFIGFIEDKDIEEITKKES
jgi:hypothetical protein